MPNSSENIIENAIRVLKVLWDETDSEKAISVQGIQKRMAAEGVRVDPRAIYAIADGAAAAGLSVVRPKGKGNGRTGLRFEARTFAPEEVAFLICAVQGSRALSNSEKRILIDKLGMLVSKNERVASDGRIVAAPAADPYWSTCAQSIDLIGNAISEDRQIEFSYWEYDTDASLQLRATSSSVPVNPLSLCFIADRYYLVASKVDDLGLRCYCLDRMSDVEVLPDRRTENLLDRNLDMRAELAQTFDAFGIGTESRQVEIAYDASIVKYVVERFGSEVVQSIDENRARSIVSVKPTSTFYAWVFQFTGLMKIVGPKDIAEDYSSMLSRAIACNTEEE